MAAYCGCESLSRCDASAQISIGTGQIAVDAVTFAEALLGLRAVSYTHLMPYSTLGSRWSRGQLTMELQSEPNMVAR